MPFSIHYKHLKLQIWTFVEWKDKLNDGKPDTVCNYSSTLVYIGTGAGRIYLCVRVVDQSTYVPSRQPMTFAWQKAMSDNYFLTSISQSETLLKKKNLTLTLQYIWFTSTSTEWQVVSRSRLSILLFMTCCGQWYTFAASSLQKIFNKTKNPWQLQSTWPEVS